MKNKVFVKQNIEFLGDSQKNKTPKVNAKYALGMLSIVSMVAGVQYLVSQSDTSAATCSSSPCNTTFQVNVKETLAVTVTPDASGGTGNIGSFLRNKVLLDVSSNNATGYTASMYASNTSLTNAADSTKTIPSVSGDPQKSAFPSNYWGYSLDATTSLNNKTYGEDDTGKDSSYYHALPTSSAPASVLTQSGSGSSTRKLYFGTKADASQASGTYTGTVVISVVTGSVQTSDPTLPSNPANPAPTVNTAVYRTAPTGGTNGTTAYTTKTVGNNNVVATRTEVSDGDNTSAYANPLGVTERRNSASGISDESESIANGSTVASGIAIAAAVTAAAGVGLLILAKRRDDDDDEEEEV